MIVSLIERQIRDAGIQQEGLATGAKLAMRLLNEIDEITLIYLPAGGRRGRPRVPNHPHRPRQHPAPALPGTPATAARAQQRFRSCTTRTEKSPAPPGNPSPHYARSRKVPLAIVCAHGTLVASFASSASTWSRRAISTS